MRLLALICLVYAFVTCVPGYLALRALGLPRPWSVCGAPLLGVSAISLLGTVYSLAGVVCSPASILAPAVAVPAIVLAAERLAGRKGARGPLAEAHLAKISLVDVLAYLVMGLVAGYFFFVGRLPWADYLIQLSDVPFHLNAIQSFAQSGRFSSLGVSFYLAVQDAAINPVPGAGFYPAGYHALCALVLQMTGVDTGYVVNAANYFFTSLVYPLAMLPLMVALFPDSPRTVHAGALACVSFVAFPWLLLIFGGVYPNLAGFCTIPFPIALFVAFLARHRGRGEAARLIAAFLLSLVGQVLLHPNTVFTAVVILVPFCIALIWRRAHEGRPGRGATPRAALGVAAFMLVVLAGWYAFWRLPAFHGLFEFERGAFTTPFQGLVDIVGLSYSFMGSYDYAIQAPLAAFVIVGAVRCLYSERLRWLPFSYLATCAIVFMGAVMSGGLRNFVCGVWYTDPNRLAAMAVLAAVPLAAFGIEWAFGLLLAGVEHYNAWRAHRTHARVVAVACVVLYAFLTFSNNLILPGSFHSQNEAVQDSGILRNSDDVQEYVMLEQQSPSVHTPFGDFRDHFDRTCQSNVPIALNEQEFLQEVQQVVGPEDLVINNPIDGSYFAYGYTGLRCYYRKIDGFRNLDPKPGDAPDDSSETQESVLIRTRLRDIATDEQVREAVAATGARYVLVMSTVNSEGSFIGGRGGYKPESFSGITSITRETPGFTLVLAQGDLALYRIDK